MEELLCKKHRDELDRIVEASDEVAKEMLRSHGFGPGNALMMMEHRAKMLAMRDKKVPEHAKAVDPVPVPKIKVKVEKPEVIKVDKPKVTKTDDSKADKPSKKGFFSK